MTLRRALVTPLAMCGGPWGDFFWHKSESFRGGRKRGSDSGSVLDQKILCSGQRGLLRCGPMALDGRKIVVANLSDTTYEWRVVRDSGTIFPPRRWSAETGGCSMRPVLISRMNSSDGTDPASMRRTASLSRSRNAIRSLRNKAASGEWCQLRRRLFVFAERTIPEATNHRFKAGKSGRSSIGP